MYILFVDDEANVLNGLRRMLRPKRTQWHMSFFQKGEEAVQFAEHNPCDVIVSDMRMPGMDGVELLSRIRAQHPESIRIALSGQTDSHMIYRCVQHAHQFLAKPCEIERLTAVVDRAFALRRLLRDDKLAELVAGMDTLPSLPEQYTAIVEELQTDEPSLKKIGAIVETDVAMSVKLLQIVNSAFFGLPCKMSSPRQATVHLGFDVVKNLVISTGIFSQFDPQVVERLRLNSVLPLGLRVGNLARAIALEVTNDKIVADLACLGGVLADVGTLVLASNAATQLAEAQQLARDEGIPDWQAETSVIGHNHMDVGAYLCGLWGLPNPIVEAVAYHHRPQACVASSFLPLSAIHIAGCFVSDPQGDPPAGLDMAYVSKLALEERIESWQNTCMESNNE